MSFQSEIGQEYPAFFEKMRCMSLLIPFSTPKEAEKMENFASMVIVPAKQFAIEKARVEFLVTENTNQYMDVLKGNRKDHWERYASMLLSAILLGVVYSKKESDISYLYRPDKYVTMLMVDNHILNLDNGINLDFARFEAFLKYLKSIQLSDAIVVKFKGVVGQTVFRENVYTSYSELLEKESNRTGCHPYVVDTIDEFLSLGTGEKSSIVQIFIAALIDMFSASDVEMSDFDRNLHTDAFFLNSQWLFNRLFKKEYSYHCSDMLSYLKQYRNSIEVGDKKLASYFPADYEFEVGSTVFVKLINSFINETIQWKTIEIDDNTKTLTVRLFVDNLFVYNKSLYFGLQAFIMFLKEKFFNLFEKLDVIIVIRKDVRNLDNIYEAVKGWMTILQNTGEGNHLYVVRQHMDEDDGFIQDKIADINLLESLEAEGQMYPLDSHKVVTVKQEVIEPSEIKPYPTLSYDHFFVEAMEALPNDDKMLPILRNQFEVALPALRMIAPKINHKKIPLLDYVTGVTYEADNFPTLVLLNFLGNYTVPVRTMKFKDGMIHHIFDFKGLEHFGMFAGLMLMAYAYNSIMDTHIKVALEFHFLENEIEYAKEYLNDWATWFLTIDEVEHIEVYIGNSLLHICDRKQ